jgi:signal transduction histidine kinase
MEENSHIKILIVDDRAENLFALEVILSNENYVCVRASSGKETLEILEREDDFAIILMDVQMPVMDGFETVELIRQIEKLKHIPIIFLTASMDSSVQIFKGYLAGAVDYITKPLSPEILKAKVAVFVDLYQKTHELLRQAEEMKKLNSEISAVNQELMAFNYIASHDLQEPLRKIQTFITIIFESDNENISATGKYNFERMQLAAGRMQQLIDDLLSFSRIANTELKYEKTDLKTIVEEVKADLKDIILEKHAIIEISELCPANVIRFQFRQLMYNLISNSLKFSHSDTPSNINITSNIVKGSKINIEKLSPDNNYCHITVKDNGIGFEPRFSERIFKVFQKLHGKEVYAGTGIGLAIVKKIVDNHHGLIIATSELTHGAQFDIYIPAD